MAFEETEKWTPFTLFTFSEKYQQPKRCICCCGKEIDEHDIEYDDYVTHPMIWCSFCQGRYFLDYIPGPRDKWTEKAGYPFLDFLPNLHPVAGKVKDFFSKYKNGEEKVYRVPLCFIKKVAGSNMGFLRSKKELVHEQVVEIGKTGIYKFYRSGKTEDKDWCPEKFLPLVKKYRLKFYFDDCIEKNVKKFLKDNKIPYAKVDELDPTNIMVDCNSYNVQLLSEDSDFVDLAHDGVTVVCQIVHQGVTKIVRYWGD